jgi:hypothetical protein
VGFGRAILFGPLEYGADVGSLLGNNGLCNKCLKRLAFDVNARWKPKRNAKAVAGALGCSSRKRACSERPERGTRAKRENSGSLSALFAPIYIYTPNSRND